MTTVKFATDVIISSHQKTNLMVSVYANQTESGITIGGQPTRNAHGGHPEQRKTGNCFIQMQIRNREDYANLIRTLMSLAKCEVE